MRALSTLLMLKLFLLCAFSSYATAQSSTQPAPLTSDEYREILRQLVKLESALATVNADRQFLEREKAVCTQEKGNIEKEAELAKKEADLNAREREIEKQRADFYEQAYKSLTKKRSKACTVAKVFTLWLWPCH